MNLLRYRLDPAALFAAVVEDPRRPGQKVAADPWQVNALRSTAKRTLYLCSRQAGKSSVAAVKALWSAMFEPESLVLIVAWSLPQSQEIFRKCRKYYMSIGQPIGVASESALRMELGNGSRIISMPGSERANVGYTANLCIIDEAGLTPSALLDALEPTVAATRGSIIALSAAYGARGWFYEQWNASDTDKVWERHIATADDSSVVTPEVVEIARLTRGERHVQSQYYCSFLHDETAYFKQEDLMRSLTLMNMEEEPMFPEACA